MLLDLVYLCLGKLWSDRWFLGKPLSSSTCQTLPTIPTINFTFSGNQVLPLSVFETIFVDEKYAEQRDNNGETLTPPSLYEFVQVFAGDARERVSSDATIYNTTSTFSNAVLFTIDETDGRYLDAAGRETSEGYSINITESGVTIAGSSPLGAWWGSRTLLQLAALYPDGLPIGHAVDAPGWRNRGVMLDIGRKFYPDWFLKELCSHLSYFKQNVFHLHLSDNLVVVNAGDEGFVDTLYSGFRLNSEDERVAGLSSDRNESFTREQFDSIQQTCAARGVTIIPEIEAPGHALPLVRWKPEMALKTDLTMLNISAPATIPSLKDLWSVFLPWFNSKTVHIGADEYDKDYVSDYNDYVNAMNEHISNESGKTTRIWGTFPPKAEYTNNIAKNVSLHHWEFFEDNPLLDYLNNGYSVLNSDDVFYVVNGYNEGYGPVLNRTAIFHGAPDGGPYAPNIFDTRNASNNPPRSHPLIEGHLAATWNDNGPNASTWSDAYYAWRNDLPALADKEWGGLLTEKQYDAVFDTLRAAIPAQNLDMTIPSKTQTIMQYPLSGHLNDLSGNEYHLTNRGCFFDESSVHFDGSCHLSTGFERKGRNYTLSFQIKPAEHTGALFSNNDSALLAGPNLTFVADGFYYPLDYSLPLHQWTNLTMTNQGAVTYTRINGGRRMAFMTEVGIAGTRKERVRMGFPAPLKTIGQGFKGYMRVIELINDV